MKTTTGYVLAKPEDFKVCKECGSINWYENKECHNCDSKSFSKSKKKVLNCANNYMEAFLEDEDDDVEFIDVSMDC